MNRSSLFVSLVAAIGGLLFGYNTSIISGALLFLSRDFVLTTFEQELVVSTLLIGAVIGAFAGGFLSNKIGRKKTLFLTVMFFFIGIVTMSDAFGFGTLLTGRFITGLACGIVSMVVPLYIAEMSPAKYRGALVSLNQLMVTFGILLAYIIQYLFAEESEWREMFSFAMLPLSLQFLGIFFISESPSWLLQNKGMDAADKVFKKFGISPESLKGKKEDGSDWRELLKPGMRTLLLVGIGITMVQQFTGINAVIYYAPKIFQATGTHTAETAIFATMFVGLVNLIFTGVSVWLIDKLGRRFLLIFGLVGMIFSILLLGFSFYSPKNSSDAVTLISLLSYVAFFAISLGPIAWLIPSEIFPLRIRSMAIGVVTFVNWTCNYIVSLTFLSLINGIGTGMTFWLYMGMSIVGLWFVWKKVPETKGKSFEEIQEFWQKK
jgi:SP family galactose:H+ symporter-like MFS transporter